MKQLPIVCTIAALAAIAAPDARAQVPVFGNFAVATSTLGQGHNISATNIVSVRFLTGSSALQVTSLQAAMSRFNFTQAAFDLFTNSSGNPGSFIATFGTVNIPGNGEYTFTPSSPILLNANTVYHIRPRAVTSTPFWFNTDTPTTPSAQNGSGIVFQAYRFTNNGGATWGNTSSTGRFRLNAIVVPEAGTLALVGAGCLVSGVGVIRRRRAA